VRNRLSGIVVDPFAAAILGAVPRGNSATLFWASGLALSMVKAIPTAPFSLSF